MPPPNRAPVAEERTIAALPLEGSLPRGLAGTLYRNGPNPVVPNPALHWFFGDGMVHAFRIRDGAVAYRNRWIRTRIWAQQSGRDPTGLPDGVANTSLLAHAGHLLALEEAHMPVRLDPETLTTLGTECFGGDLPTGPFTAHPKRCPRTGNLVFFGYGADGLLGNQLRLGEIAPDGRLLWIETIETPLPGAMVHDFAVSEHHIAIPLFPLVLDLEQGGFAWKPDQGRHLGLIDRARGAASLRWLPLPSGFAFHIANAWDQNGILAIETMRSEAPPLFPGPGGDTAAHLTRLTLEPGSDSSDIETDCLTTAEGELPRIDDRKAGRRARFTYWTSGTTLYAHDAESGALDRFGVEGDDNVSEPIFVPGGTGEGDGWLLAVQYRAASETSDLLVLNARELEAGPVARAKLPVRVPDGFHGVFVS